MRLRVLETNAGTVLVLDQAPEEFIDVAQLTLTVLMAVLTGHQAGARRRRERVLDEGTVEAHTTLGETVDIRGRCEL